MNFSIEELATERQMLLDALDANRGDINLGIFEDFYPDEAHFIYELLQNAEDAGATKASFELTPQRCVFEHNGPRDFNERDIRGITGIFNSSKRDDPDKIGKFGVGFKSVFVYTDTPSIYSKHFSFRITKLILPESISPMIGLGDKTRFEFPFDNSKKNDTQAFAEVKAGLEQLSETTLLFLNNLQCISWMAGDQMGTVIREEHSEGHVEVLKETDGREDVSSHWLRFLAPVEVVAGFSAPVEGLERQKVAVAYELTFTGEQKDFDPKRPIAKQLKIVSSAKGRVSVFFPAEKEISGLRFHLHAPFIPELSRASIKNSPENLPLFEQLSKLTANSLHRIKELGLLTGEFLAVLPNNDDDVAERYRVIRTSIIQEMKEQPLTPTHARGFSPASKLIQAKATTKDLLSDEDLALLLGRSDNPTWAIGATSGNQGRFLNGLGIPEWDAESLTELLKTRARETAYSWQGRLDPAVMGWLSSKSDEWTQRLYAVLYKHCDGAASFDSLAEAKIVRLTDGSCSVGSKAYFSTGPVNPKGLLPRVAEGVLTAGKKEAQQADARKLLERLGVRVPGETEVILLTLQARYSDTSKPPSDKIYIADLIRCIKYAEKNPQEREIFRSARLFRVDSEKHEWTTSASVYLDEPFKKTGLEAYHGSLPPAVQKKWPLSRWYLTCGLEIGKLASFAESVGCTADFREFFVETTCEKNAQWEYLRNVPGERYTSSINDDFSMTQVAFDLLRSKHFEFSRLIWVTMCSSGTNFLQARYRKNASSGSRHAESRLIQLLRSTEWVPLRDGTFVAPRKASREDLLEGFTFDSGYKWLDAVKFGEEGLKKSVENNARAARRSELGFDNEEDLVLAQAFSKLPLDERKRILAAEQSPGADEEEFPERPMRNPDLRSERVRELAEKTPEKTSHMRTRSVAEGYGVAKAETRLYLREQYTNSNGVMFCQVCKSKEKLPFKLPNGAYYFEAVEISDSLGKRFRETFLALCPNHAAMFRYANEQKNSITELVTTAAGLEIELVLGGSASTVQFTETHLADIKACLESEGVDDAGAR